MDLKMIVNVCSKAWALPVLAAMGDGVPGRQVTLLKATGAGRSAFGPSISHLVDLDLVRRCGGHGHPLRPEFELTDHGRVAAKLAVQALEEVRGFAGRALLRKAWTFPVIAVLSQEDAYGEVRRALSPITDRALSQSLQSLERATWIERQVNVSARPPKPVYQTVGTGARLAEIWLENTEMQ